jgi:hypothetical protein
VKFVLFVKGHTEHRVLNAFLKRWLDPRLPQPVGISTVRFEGFHALLKDLPIKVPMYLKKEDVIAVISLIDLYGPTYPESLKTVNARIKWATERLSKGFDPQRYRHFFAVHETEAWLFSEPSIFEGPVKNDLGKLKQPPEKVDSNKPPSKRLHDLYLKHLGKGYKKVSDGAVLFRKLNPEAVYHKCPRFKEMLDTMLAMAQRPN